MLKEPVRELVYEECVLVFFIFRYTKNTLFYMYRYPITSPCTETIIHNLGRGLHSSLIEARDPW